MTSQAVPLLSLAETSAYPPILNRAEARQHAGKLELYNNALAQLVDYGTLLVPRAYTSSARKLRDVVVIPILFKQVLAMIDAATELLKEGCVEPAILQLRAALEASIYLDWIAASKVSYRARAYYVWNIRRALRWVNRGIRGTPEFRAFKRDMQGLAIQSTLATREKQRELRAERKRLEAYLLEPQNAAWQRRFDQRRGKSPHDVEWYQILFRKRRSLASLAKAVRRMPEYRIYYELGSEEMHSSRSNGHVRILGDGQVVFRSLRELVEYPHIFQGLTAIGLHACQTVLNQYRTGEARAFAQKYVETWRKAFLTRLTVTYERQPVTIG